MCGLLRILVCAVIPLALVSPPLHAKPHFVAFSLGAQTFPTSINNKGAVTGYVSWVDEHGFVRQPDGSAVFFDVPGSNAHGVVPTSINDSGDVTGYYYRNEKPGEVSLGFVRKSDGTITTFRVPHDVGGDDPIFINSNGTIFGNYLRHRTWFGFARSPDGTITALDCPTSAFSLRGANDAGQAVGGDVLRGADDSCTQIDAGWPYAINAEGSIAGLIGYPAAMNYLRTPDGVVTQYKIPANASYVFPAGINATRIIAGYFTDLDLQKGRGYVRNAKGHVSVFDAPNSTTFTTPVGINDAGAIAGSFADRETGDPTGFVRFP